MVAYKLALPAGSRIHDVFHVSLLKAFRGTPPDTTLPLPPVHDGRVLLRPTEVLRSRLNRGVKEVLVRWMGAIPEEASWESLDNFQMLFLNFNLRTGLLIWGGGGVLMR